MVSCKDLTDPTNGKVDVGGRTPGSTAVYSCNTGYTLVGVSERTCGDDGLWSDKEPVCECELISVVQWHMAIAW